MGGQSPANDAKNLLVNGWTQIYTQTYNDIYGKGNPFCDQKREKTGQGFLRKLLVPAHLLLPQCGESNTTHPFLCILLLHA